MTPHGSADPAIRDAVARLNAACSEFQPAREIARTGKSLVLEGRFLGAKAVSKVLTDHGEFWWSRLRNELAFYRRTSANPPPVTIPRLLYGDGDLGVLILEYLDGRRLASDRYPETPVGDRDFALLLDALPDLHAWKPTPAPSREEIMEELERRMEKHVDRGILPERDAVHAGELIRATSWVPTFNHRDVLLTNFLMLHGGLALIDWEYAGYALPGYDEALLWVVLMHDARKRDQIVARAQTLGETQTLLFMVNAISVLAREIHMLRASSDEALRLRAAALESDLEQVRDWLRVR